MRNLLKSTPFLLLAIIGCSTGAKSARMDAGAAPAPAAEVSASTDAPERPQSTAPTPGQLLIYNASFTLEAKEAETRDLSGRIVDKAKGLGGYLSQRGSTSVTVRVPSKEFYPMNDFIRSLAKVRYENATAQDVTMQYTDLKIRLDVQLKMLARYEELLKKSTSVKDAVEVERELSRITERVETLKGQIRYYDSQIGYSTISVSFQEPYSAFTKETKPGPLGWVFYGAYVVIKWLFVWD
ncbi:MAG TPA: DUF4349 domain-containing protein [Turneriella sp.]|nr:DUF4349 domain-containing protein [Turneriella sp.]HMY10556.1 DUF4349 domain-containing protein [Turneriella sp.]HNE18135.1 DUF4349 domain-containing protein [Turneriella sp.]HNJ65324.1 DUF4349 domain-containing protein [Turneriella sp.]HNL10380.1 DUF4349 domain-containing protein [Turneriella sp.]